MKVALCVIVKNENKYLKEYIEYYRDVIKIDHIYIYDNNLDDDTDEYKENIHDVTQEYEDDNYVTIVDVRGKLNYQVGAYMDCYNKYGNNYDWICFFDADEFLNLQNFNSIQEFVGQEKFNKFLIITIPWLCYGDSEQLYYEDKPVQERFKVPVYNYNSFFDNLIIKSIIKTNIKNLVWDFKIPLTNTHLPNVLFGVNGNLPLYICDINGNYMYPDKMNNETLNDNLFYNVHLKHYWCKSTEEYIIKRLKGWACGGLPHNIDRDIDEYFRRNRFSVKKLRLMENIYENYKDKIN